MSRPHHTASGTAKQDCAVVEQYEGWARVYDILWGRYMRKTLPVLQEATDIRTGERVLDLACGTGELERRVADAGAAAEIVGIDLAEGMIERARQKTGSDPRVRYETADAHDLPFSESAFDVAVSANTFHYFSRPDAVLREARRVLRPGGRIVLLDWCRDFWTCRLMDAVLHRLDPAYSGCYTKADMSGLLEGASFDVRASRMYRFDVVWGMMVVEAGVRTGAA